MLVGGQDVRTVSGRLGHANAATTLGIYAHFMEAADHAGAEMLGKLLDDRPGTGASEPATN
jgi:integrase